MSPNDHIILIERMVRMEEKIDILVKAQEKHDALEDRVETLETHHKILTTLGGIIVFALTFFQDNIASIFRI